MTPLQPGECRHRIKCDEPRTSQAENGEELVDFVQVFGLLCKIEPLNGRELLQSGQVIADGTTRIRVFWSPQAERINAKWRLRHRGVIYNIAGPPSNIEFARREIEIIATSGVNLG